MNSERSFIGQPAELRETHSSIVVLAGDLAFKIKKPVDLGFLDFRDDATRRAVSLREIELNRRLAPDVYLEAVHLVGDTGTRYGEGLVMRRMPDESRLSTMIRHGDPVSDHLRSIARSMARFHRSAARSPEISTEGVDGLRRRWLDNLAESERLIGTLLKAEQHAAIKRLALEFIDGRGSLLAERAASGQVVDGHGDLLAEDIFCLPDGPRILDCLEFDDRLRYVDVLDDIAFLAMDLEHLGRAELGRQLLDAYVEFSGIEVPAGLWHHFLAYRAFVRCKVTSIQAELGSVSAVSQVSHLAEMTLRHLESGEVRLVLVGGVPGSGKTVVSRALAAELGCVALSSDDVRTEFELPSEVRYTNEAKRTTSRTMVQRATRMLQSGRSVVLDATWGDPSMREIARTAARDTSSRLICIQCQVDPEIASARAQRRFEAHVGTSEADAQVSRVLAAQFALWEDAVQLDTSGPVEDTIADALKTCGRIRLRDGSPRQPS